MALQPYLEGLTEQYISDRTRMVQSLSEFRREWQKAVEGKSLFDVEAPVGLILADIADRLQLTPQERHAFLGGQLIGKVDSLLEERVTSTPLP